MVNGAGLAMATMDIIKLAGGRACELPSTWAGGANAEQIPQRVPHPDDGQRRAPPVFINIFGGILRCDVLAEGVIAAVARPQRGRCRS